MSNDFNISSGTGGHVGETCTRCGRPYHGSAACESFSRVSGYCGLCQQQWSGAHNCPRLKEAHPLALPTFTITGQPGWTCPVCGTGCAPWVAYHCQQPSSLVQPEPTEEQQQ